MNAETYIERGLNPMPRGLLTEQGRGQMPRLNTGRAAPAMQAARLRRWQAAAR
jgi:hypothetical protein